MLGTFWILVPAHMLLPPQEEKLMTPDVTPRSAVYLTLGTPSALHVFNICHLYETMSSRSAGPPSAPPLIPSTYTRPGTLSAFTEQLPKERSSAGRSCRLSPSTFITFNLTYLSEADMSPFLPFMTSLLLTHASGLHQGHIPPRQAQESLCLKGPVPTCPRCFQGHMILAVPSPTVGTQLRTSM